MRFLFPSVVMDCRYRLRRRPVVDGYLEIKTDAEIRRNRTWPIRSKGYG
jgi:hypothetical protein